MANYNIQINERMALGRGALAFLQSIPQVVSFEKQKEVISGKSELYHNLNSAFADVRLMMDGKKKEKTAQEFLEEIRSEK